jgi:hypothetical protein
MLEHFHLNAVLALLRAHLAQLRRQDGYTTETVIVTALLITAALAAGVIIVAKIMEKAAQISGA